MTDGERAQEVGLLVIQRKESLPHPASLPDHHALHVTWGLPSATLGTAQAPVEPEVVSVAGETLPRPIAGAEEFCRGLKDTAIGLVLPLQKHTTS